MIEISASAYTIPTDAPEADGTLEWDSTTIVLVEARAEESTGIGWTYGPATIAGVVTELLAPEVAKSGVPNPPAAHESMCRAVRNAGRPGTCSMAISAVDCALWDLKARRLGLPLHRLLGAVHEEVPVYGSGGFTTYDDARTREQLEHWAGEQRIPRVKIKIGEAWGGREARDIERLRLAREAVGPGTELFADANGAYSAKQAIRVAGATDIRWLEEPVSSDDLAGLATVRDAVTCEVAAGEYGYDLPYFARLLPVVDCPQADVTRIGGITEFLRVAGLARAHGKDLSAHCAPHLHAAAMAAIPNARHIEWFHDHVRIESMLFDGVLDPAGGTVRPRDDAPGLGLEFKRADAEPYRVA
ncbi:enolase C-terminal domain-like protein [Actinoallomurus iriomotensis]|uniref:Mandelate racemase n=1 Tax=Actinoallomurus iriomotensis TaxID=478107 RepID=A0A9W6S4P1_9ACTN|nr:enolase C-terminal domain-like protein [Actinoallomurus iriomotensis]GLY85330.1 mandelate racemase [Actinoallomurus iriomotensis]